MDTVITNIVKETGKFLYTDAENGITINLFPAAALAMIVALCKKLFFLKDHIRKLHNTSMLCLNLLDIYIILK